MPTKTTESHNTNWTKLQPIQSTKWTEEEGRDGKLYLVNREEGFVISPSGVKSELNEALFKDNATNVVKGDWIPIDDINDLVPYIGETVEFDFNGSKQIISIGIDTKKVPFVIKLKNESELSITTGVTSTLLYYFNKIDAELLTAMLAFINYKMISDREFISPDENIRVKYAPDYDAYIPYKVAEEGRQVKSKEAKKLLNMVTGKRIVNV